MASDIDPVLAKSLISEYQNQNTATNGPSLLAPNGQPLKGFMIDRESIEKIFQNPNVVGISLNYAKHPDFAGLTENVFTFIMTGAEPNPNHGHHGTPYVSTCDCMDFIVPCPPMCTHLIF